MSTTRWNEISDIVYYNVAAVELFRCDPGYIFDPTGLSGEAAREVTVRCSELADSLPRVGWTLLNGEEVPECVAGQHS